MAELLILEDNSKDVDVVLLKSVHGIQLLGTLLAAAVDQESLVLRSVVVSVRRAHRIIYLQEVAPAPNFVAFVNLEYWKQEQSRP